MTGITRAAMLTLLMRTDKSHHSPKLRKHKALVIRLASRSVQSIYPTVGKPVELRATSNDCRDTSPKKCNLCISMMAVFVVDFEMLFTCASAPGQLQK